MPPAATLSPGYPSAETGRVPLSTPDSGGSGIGAGLPTRQLQAQVASASWQLTVLGNQLMSVTPLAPVVRTLIPRLESFTEGDPGVNAFLGQLQQVGDSTPTVESLASRVGLVSRSLARLASADRLAARGLAPSLPALRALLMDLLAPANKGGALAASQPSGTDNPAVGMPQTLAAPARAGAVRRDRASLAPTAQGLQQFSEQAASGPINEQSDGMGVAHQPTSTSGAVGASVTAGGTLPVSGAQPVSAPLQAGGAAGAASGGIGAGAPALALLVVAAVWLLHALLPGRLGWDLLPWKSTLLPLRLERPG